jgi:hypothetical protein
MYGNIPSTHQARRTSPKSVNVTVRTVTNVLFIEQTFYSKGKFDTNLVGGVGGGTRSSVCIKRQRTLLKSESSTLRTVILVNKRFMKHVKFDMNVVGGVGGGTQSFRHQRFRHQHFRTVRCGTPIGHQSIHTRFRCIRVPSISRPKSLSLDAIVHTILQAYTEKHQIWQRT